MIGIIQARMNSQRFPGKVLAPFRGRPLINHVYERVARVLGRDSVVVATSSESSDDPLVAYLDSINIATHRGALNDVLGRIVECAGRFPGMPILRISADSPEINESVIARAVQEALNHEVDLVTTIFPRTFPKGSNVEILSADALDRLNRSAFTSHDREHVTAYCYTNPEQFTIRNLTSGDPSLASLSIAVDTVEDLVRLESVGTGIPATHSW